MEVRVRLPSRKRRTPCRNSGRSTPIGLRGITRLLRKGKKSTMSSNKRRGREAGTLTRNSVQAHAQMQLMSVGVLLS
jgi:hypothetical protein